MKTFEQFINAYSLSKTLRFELRPVGKTMDWIEQSRILNDDEQKSISYPQVKQLIDEYHKVCISESLNRKAVNFDWKPLYMGHITKRIFEEG